MPTSDFHRWFGLLHSEVPQGGGTGIEDQADLGVRARVPWLFLS